MAAAPPLAKMKDSFESALQNTNQSSHRAFVEEEDHRVACGFSNYKLLRTLIWDREGAAMCHLLIAQSNWSTGQWSNQLWSNSGQNCKKGQTRGVELEIGQKLNC